MEALTPWHLSLIILGFVLLFGYKKLPDAARSLGRSLRIFRSEMRDMTDHPAAADDGSPGGTATSALPTPDPVAALEAEAAAAESLAAELRARAEGQPARRLTGG